MRRAAGSTASLVVKRMKARGSGKRSEKRREKRLLSRRILQAQEVERDHMAVELHDHITQALCTILMRLEIMTGHLPAEATASREEAAGISEQVGEVAENVERISSRLRPSILGMLGLVPALRYAITEFIKRTGLELKLACARAPGHLSAEADLVLYRILEEALKNVERHAHAHLVSVNLKQSGVFAQLTIRDDGVGFDTNHRPARRAGRGSFGLLGLQERAASVGGNVRIKSAPLSGTRIVVRIPLLKGQEADVPGRERRTMGLLASRRGESSSPRRGETSTSQRRLIPIRRAG